MPQSPKKLLNGNHTTKYQIRKSDGLALEMMNRAGRMEDFMSSEEKGKFSQMRRAELCQIWSKYIVYSKINARILWLKTHAVRLFLCGNDMTAFYVLCWSKTGKKKLRDDMEWVWCWTHVSKSCRDLVLLLLKISYMAQDILGSKLYLQSADKEYREYVVAYDLVE